MAFQLQLGPTSIRPMGEKQLRMFQRTMGRALDTQRIKTLNKQVPVYLSGMPVDFKKAHALGIRNRLATLEEAVLDINILNKLNESTYFFIGWRGFPEKMGWYRINRSAHCIAPMPTINATQFKWDRKLFILQSAIDAAVEKQPLTIEINAKSSELAYPRCGYYDYFPEPIYAVLIRK